MKKKLKISSLALAGLMILAACGRSDVTAQSSDFWEKFVYGFALVIRWLSVGGSTGVGIILFTVLIRTVLLPVFQMQANSSRKMQEVQPQIKALQEKYPGKDLESRTKISEETQRIFKEAGVNQYATLIPMAIQLPVLMALYQALTRVAFLRMGHFFWLTIAEPDPYYILPILAALFTFVSMWLSNKGLPEKSGALNFMTYVMPIVIFFFALNVASGVGLYWAVSYAYQVCQTLLLSNPFKMIAEREAKLAAKKEQELKKKRALKKARKKKK